MTSDQKRKLDEIRDEMANEHVKLVNAAFAKENATIDTWVQECVQHSFEDGWVKAVAHLSPVIEACIYGARVTYGTELCNSDEENNEIIASHFYHGQGVLRKALTKVFGEIDREEKKGDGDE